MIPIALTIAGSDPSGGAGIQADLKTFHQFGVYGTSVLTLVTVQNTSRAGPVELLSPEFVLAQLDAVLEDLPPQAAKTGALGSREVIEALAKRAAHFSFPLVVDPVMVTKHGTAFIPEDARTALIRRLLPHAFLLTPNLEEASSLAGREVRDPASMQEAARAIAALGPQAVLVTGGHLDPATGAEATDVLYAEGRFHCFSATRIATRHTHGAGCTFSAAITAELAKGTELVQAVSRAKQFITRAIETNPRLGHGSGPLNHFAAF